MTELIIELVTVALQIVVVACIGLFTKYALPWLQDVVIPWLKERHLYNLICYFVRAAEKLADTGVIDKTTKKEYVIKLLKEKNVVITHEVDALIESAVMDLDMAISGAFDMIYDSFEEIEIESESDKPEVNDDMAE